MFKRVLECENTDTDVSRLVPWQNEYYCRLDFLWRDKFKRECEEIETMENLNRVLLENVLPSNIIRPSTVQLILKKDQGC